MTWTYRGEPYTTPDIDDVGFVYCITEINSGKKYIGKKLFWTKVKRKPRGTKRVQRVQRESDWKKYYGSSNNLKLRLEYHGPLNYKREILYIGKSKGVLSYLETYEQFTRNVLVRDEYYNEIINCRINAKHLKVDYAELQRILQERQEYEDTLRVETTN